MKQNQANPYLPNKHSIQESFRFWLVKLEPDSIQHLGLKELARKWMADEKPNIYLPKNGFLHQAHLDWFKGYEWDLTVNLTLQGVTQTWSIYQQEYELGRLARDYWNRLDRYAYGNGVKRFNTRILRAGFRQKMGLNPHIHAGLVIPKHINQDPAERRRFKRILNWAWDGLSPHTGMTKIVEAYDADGWNDYDSRELWRYDTAPDTWCRWSTTVSPASKD